MEHRRQVGVIVVQRMRENAVQECRHRRGNPIAHADGMRLLVPALVGDELARTATRVE